MAMEKHFIQEGKIRSEMDSFLRRELSKAVYCGMDIHKTPLAVRINLYVEKPPLVIGKKGRRINKLTRMLEQKYNIENLAIDVQRVENPVLNSEVIARRIATALERRMYRRRVVYRAIRAIMSAGARGVEITLSGKIIGKGGRSRTEKYSEGYMKKAGDSTEGKSWEGEGRAEEGDGRGCEEGE
ncbi:MAG: 30S ribosomal protein S3 [Candidatus Altiarchaeales archaeon ex4484_2]|nr:MAG: 30S ribosomal protein S3 [Candidatus Altiarchaeales archaeon ex4484_2]